MKFKRYQRLMRTALRRHYEHRARMAWEEIERRQSTMKTVLRRY